MNPLRSFDEFLKDGIVKGQSTDRHRSASLAGEAARRKAFLEDMRAKIGINDDNANYFVENSYDMVMELIRARMLMDGFKASGISAHEAEVSYLRKMGFPEADVRFANELRYFRNGINYYGRRMDAEYAGVVLEFIGRIYPKLQQMAKG